MGKKLVFSVSVIILIVFLLPLISANSFGFDNQNIPVLRPVVSTTSTSTNISGGNYTFNETQFEVINDTNVSIKTSWLTSFVNALSKWSNYWTKTENINQSGYNISADCLEINGEKVCDWDSVNQSGGGSSVSFGTDNQIPFTNAGGNDFDYSANLTYNGTTLTANQITDSGLTSGRVTFAGASGLLIDDASLTYSTSTGLLTTKPVKINTNSATALFVEQDGVKDNTFIVDTTNGAVGIGVAPTTTNSLTIGDATKVNGIDTSRTIASRVAGSHSFRGIDSLTWTGAGTGASVIRGADFGIIDARSVTGVLGLTDTVHGGRISINRQAGYNTAGGGTIGSYQGTLLGFTTNAVDQGTYNDASLNHALTFAGGETRVGTSPTIALNTKTFTYEGIGQNIIFSGTPVLTSGTFNADYYGVKVAMTGNTVGTSVGYSYYADTTGYDTNWAFYNAKATNNFLGLDNSKTYFGTAQDASIKYDGTNLVFTTDETGSGIAYFTTNVSADEFITRTSVFDKKQGSALDLIKDSDELKSIDGTIDHSKFYGYTKYEVTDMSKPVNNTYVKCSEEDTGKEICQNVSEITYPHKKIEEGVNIVDEIELLRQSVYELKQQNEFLQEQINNLTGENIEITEANKRQDEALCSIKLFSWCLIK
jgi:hypothetical protein